MLLAKMPDGTPEIYAAFQGEGATTGELCVFVRTMGCSLNCDFCDTSYTWLFEGSKLKHRYSDPVRREEFSLRMTPEDISIAIRKAAGPIRRIIFTGGEPLLQQKELADVVDILCSDNEEWVIEVETNGTVMISENELIYIDIINCSPKMKNSGNTKARRDKPEVIQQFVELGTTPFPEQKVTFKFVVGVDTFKEDMKEIRAWQKKYEVSNDMVYLMPEGIEPTKIIEGTKYLFDNACKKYGYHLSTRVQVLIYGNKRAT